MQRKLMALIMACGMTFAAIPLCVQAENTDAFSTAVSVKEESSEATLLAMFEGEGTKENPYILSTPQHFQLLSVCVNMGLSEYNSAYYELANSIDFSEISDFIPIGKVDTKLDYPGEGDFAPYKSGTYGVSANFSATIDTEYGQFDVGSELFSSATITIEKSGKATLKLNFDTAEIKLSDDVTAKFFVSDSYGVHGVETAATIGYLKNDGTWVNYGDDGIDKISISKSSTSGMVVPSYTLAEGTSGVKYIKQISFPLDVKKDTYSLALAIDSNVVGAQLGTETENPVTLNINWSAFSAPIYPESEFVEKITAKYPFSGHFNGNGYTLKNITINSSSRLIGVFGFGYNAIVENLRITNLNINAIRDGTMYIGGLFGNYEGNWGKSDLHITGCHLDGKINVSSEKNAYTGGLIGVHEVSLNAANVSDCRVDIDINSVSGTTSYVGGMIATIESGIDLSKSVVTGEAYGETLGDANPYTGGIAARIVYDDWIGTAGYEEASLMAQQGYSKASNLVSSIKIQSVGLYNPLIGNTFTKVNEATVSECYYDSQFAVDGTLDSYTGIAKTYAQLFDKDFLSGTVGLDFENTWTMVLGEPDLISKDPYIAYKADGASLKVQPVGCGDCKVIAAAYDSDGRVVASRIASYTEGTPVTFSFEDEGLEVVKIFAFDSSYSPLCQAESIILA